MHEPGAPPRVAAAAEPLALAGECDDVDVRVEIRLLHGGGQLARHLEGDAVAALRAVERYPGDAIVDLVPQRLHQSCGRWRSTIRAQSIPGGSVPSARPRSPASRVAQNASATAGSACCTMTDPCKARAIFSTTRRARNSMSVRSESSRFKSSTYASSRGSVPATDPISSMNASTDPGDFTIARSTSSELTLPDPSQIEFSGASR